MTTLYTVDIGDYSDRRTIGIVDETKKAIIESTGSLDGIKLTHSVRITPFRLNNLAEMPAGYTPYEVQMYMDDGKAQVYEASLYEYLGRDEYDFTNELEMIRHVVAESEEHAVKIVNEERARIKAGGVGV